MSGMAGALVGAAGARPDAGLKQAVDDELVPVGGPRQYPRREIAHIGAPQVERDAGAQLVDVLLGEICVGASGAHLNAAQARVDGRRDIGDATGYVGRRGLQHVSRVGHCLGNSSMRFGEAGSIAAHSAAAAGALAAAAPTARRRLR